MAVADGMQDWALLERGQNVALEHPNGLQLRGVLDERTDDASVLWIQMNDGAGRRLVHSEDGFRLVTR